MKALIFSLSVFTTVSSFAQMNNWTFQNEVVEKALNHRQYLDLQAKYPGVLRNEDSRTFKSAVLKTLYFTYTGETICEAGDARLSFRSHGVTVCRKNNACYSIAPLHPYGEEDPCLE